MDFHAFEASLWPIEEDGYDADREARFDAVNFEIQASGFDALGGRYISIRSSEGWRVSFTLEDLATALSHAGVAPVEYEAACVYGHAKQHAARLAVGSATESRKD